ncbi:MAG: hypothetical protein ACI9LG_001951 [Moritella dasanensis]|jgi:hypothetical protein
MEALVRNDTHKQKLIGSVTVPAYVQSVLWLI